GRGAVEDAVQGVDLVGHFVDGNAEAGARLGEVGFNVGPGEDQGAGFPGFADEFVIPLVQYAGGVDVGAVHAEGFGVDDQFTPAGESFGAEFEQGQAAEPCQLRPLDFVEGEAADRGEDLVGEEARC